MQDYSTSSLTRSEQLLDSLRKDIIVGLIAAGERITEESLAERYGLSRTPVREALRVLAREGLLSYTPRHGYLVETIDIAEMDDLYAVRIAIEEQAALRIATTGEYSALNNLLEYWGEMPDGVAHGNLNLVFADEHFHETLAAASNSSVLTPMLQNINRRLHALRARDFIDDADRVRLTFDQHAAILRALLRKETELARAMLRAHILESHTYVRDRFLRERGEQP